jgi:hypothetical protein
VRKWKKARNSIQRKVLTFRQTPLDLVPKRKNVFNKTLKKYIPLPVLYYLKQKYIEMRRLRRKHRKEQKMMGGKGVKSDVLISDPNVTAIAISAIATAKAINGSKNNDQREKNEEDKANPNAEGEDVNSVGAEGEEGKTDVGAEGEKGTKEGAEGAEGTEGKKEEGATEGDKKKGGFSLGPEIPGDISINSETHEYKDTKRLLDFLVMKGLPYYIQIELKPGTLLDLKNTDIFDLRRILFGKFVKKPTKTDLHLKTGGEYVGIAEGDTITNEYPNDVFIFTKDKVSIDKSSDENKVVVISGEKKLPPLLDSKRLYKLSGDSPSSIDDTDDIKKVDVTAIDEFRIQVAPLSQDDMKAALTAAPSEDSKKKKKKVVSDDTPTYVVNLNEKCKITSIQTLRKSLEVVRGDLEDEDEVSKTNAMGIFKLLISLLQNPEFAKNDGFDEFKENVYGFTYKIPGTERKYGFMQLVSFFDQKKDDMPPALTKEFFKLLTLLGHGPAGENGACLAFDRPQALEVIEYIKTLENGDIVTTKKLGSKMNIEGLGSELDKLNGPNEPKEEDDKKEKGEEGAKEGEEGAGAAGEEGTSKGEKEGATGEEATEKGAAEEKEEATEKVKEDEGVSKPDDNSLPTPSEGSSQKQTEITADANATAVAIAAISAAQANMNNQPTDTILLKDIPKEPIPPSEEVKAINELYKNDKTKRKSKIEKILRLKKNFNQKLTRIVTILQDIFKKSLDSISNSTNKKNMYVGTSEYKGKIAELEGLVEEIKDDPDYKIIKDYPDKITSDLKISKLWKDDNEKNLLAKIDKLFYIYWNIWQSFNSAYDYFKKYKDMKDSMMAINDSSLEIGARFRKELTNMERYISDLNKDASDTATLEQQLMTAN